MNILATLSHRYNDNEDFIHVNELEYNTYVQFLSERCGGVGDRVMKFDGKIIKKIK